MIGCLTVDDLNAHVARSSEFTVIGNRTDWNEDGILVGKEKTRLGMGLYKWNGEMYIPYAFAQ